MLGCSLLGPDKSRTPQYDVVNNPNGRFYTFGCIKCKVTLQLDLNKYLGQCSDAQSILGAENENLVKEHFGLAVKTLNNGWPRFRVEQCKNCKAQYLVYVAAFEPRNGWHQLVVQGITELTVQVHI